MGVINVVKIVRFVSVRGCFSFGTPQVNPQGFLSEEKKLEKILLIKKNIFVKV